MLSIILQKSANNEIRLGVQSIRKLPRRQGDKTAQTRAEAYARAVQEVETITETVRVGSRGELCRSGGWICRDYGLQEASRELVPPLDIINEFQRATLVKKNRGGWGFAPKPTAFGKRARHVILEAGAVCDRAVGSNIVEVTCTIPGSTREAFKAVSDWSGWIMNRLTQLVRRRCPEALWFYVWELQKRGALHLHFAIGHDSLTTAKSLAEELEFQWWELMLELRDKAGVDVFDRGNGKSWRLKPQVWQSHVLPVYKSVAAYFSKYLGKGNSKGKDVTPRPYRFYPARWWGCSSTVKRLIAESRVRYEIQVISLQNEQVVQRLQDFLDNPGRVCKYGYEFDLGVSKKGYPIGGGWREISYYKPEVFAYMQTWLDFVIADIVAYADIPSDCIHRHPAVVCSEYDLEQQFKLASANFSPSPLVCPSLHQSDSLLSTGISRKRTVDSKVIDVQSLREGMGKVPPTSAMSALPQDMSALHTPALFRSMQLTLPFMQ